MPPRGSGGRPAPVGSFVKIAARVASLLIGLVFVYSGVSKVIDPDGVVPHVFQSLWNWNTHAQFLRVLGIVEVLVGAGIVVPATRSTSSCAGCVLLLGFSILLAIEFPNGDFLQSCGCFGRQGGPLGKADTGGALILRNVGIGWCLLWSRLEQRSLGRGSAFGRSLIFAGVVAASCAFIAMASEAEMANRLLAAHEEAAESMAEGRAMPEFDVYTNRGDRASSTEVIRARDTVMFASTRCPHCLELSNDLDALRRSAESAGGRLLLCLTDGNRSEIDQFQRTIHWGERQELVYRLLDSATLVRLGVAGVPAIVMSTPDIGAAWRRGGEGHPAAGKTAFTVVCDLIRWIGSRRLASFPGMELSDVSVSDTRRLGSDAAVANVSIRGSMLLELVWTRIRLKHDSVVETLVVIDRDATIVAAIPSAWAADLLARRSPENRLQALIGERLGLAPIDLAAVRDMDESADGRILEAIRAAVARLLES